MTPFSQLSPNQQRILRWCWHCVGVSFTCIYTGEALGRSATYNFGGRAEGYSFWCPYVSRGDLLALAGWLERMPDHPLTVFGTWRITVQGAAWLLADGQFDPNYPDLVEFLKWSRAMELRLSGPLFSQRREK